MVLKFSTNMSQILTAKSWKVYRMILSVKTGFGSSLLAILSLKHLEAIVLKLLYCLNHQNPS